MNPEALLNKLNDAFNQHDIDAFAGCFDAEYHSEQPLHPDRTFRGQEQARKNWALNFAEMPDFSAELLRHTINDNTIWAEWDWQGTRQDKSRLHMRGVTIFGVENGTLLWGRLYMEPVAQNGTGIEEAVAKVMLGRKPG